MSAGGEETPLETFAHRAMGTAFEVLLPGRDRSNAKALAEEAFAELDRLEGALSRFRPESDISRLNRAGAGDRLRLGVSAYDCLRLAEAARAETGGAFDVAASPGRPATADERRPFIVHEEENAVTVLREDPNVDLGGIGKGYAVDRMVERLREWGAEAGLVHGGQSVVRGWGARPDGGAWEAALRGPSGATDALATVVLRGGALSGSGVQTHGPHIVDPATGRPPEQRRAAWALAPSAARADALSTAFMIMSRDAIEACCRRHAEVGAAVLDRGGQPDGPLFFGDWEVR
ncbi:MAG: FAD:protein FMN transferase [Planctomycetota bacterium]